MKISPEQMRFSSFHCSGFSHQEIAESSEAARHGKHPRRGLIQFGIFRIEFYFEKRDSMRFIERQLLNSLPTKPFRLSAEEIWNSKIKKQFPMEKYFSLD